MNITLRRVTVDDVKPIQALTTDPDWLRNIGSRGVTDEQSAKRYIEQSVIPGYQVAGMGLFAVVDADANEFMGLCGLLKRQDLPVVDLGFALLPDFRGKGVVTIASRLVLGMADNQHHTRVLAITLPQNLGSQAVLQRLGFSFLRSVVREGEKLNLYQWAR